MANLPKCTMWMNLLLLLCCICIGSAAVSSSTIVAAEISSSSPSPHPTTESKVAHDEGIPAIIDPTTCPSIKETNTEHATKRKKLEVVTFAAQEEVRSTVLPLPGASTSSTTSNHNLYNFFTATENIDLQFAERAEVHHITHPSHDLMDIFHRLNAQRRLEVGLTPTPTHADSTTRIVGLTNPPMHCLGLVLHSITNVGIQTFVEGDYPEVHLTLMETEFVATGPQFLVNLFNKIMVHEDNNAEGKQKAVDTIWFTRIWADPATNKIDEHTDGIVFVDQARLEARIYVPPLLIRLFPMSKRRMEKAGTATNLKTIRKDMIPAMDRLVGAYRLWIDGQDDNVKPT